MMLNVLLDQLFCDVPGTPSPITDGPEVIAPVALLECWEFFLEVMRGSSLEGLHHLANTEFWRIFDVQVNVIDAHCSFEDLNVLAVADLDEDVSATLLDVSCEHLITVLRDPNQVHRETRKRVAAMSVRVRHSRPS